jgi:Family of unknown function (DUF6516)
MDRTDHSLDNLLALDSAIIVLERDYWVKFEAKEIKQSEGRPHGIKYSLTLHNKYGERIIGFDNAHKIPGKDDTHTFDSSVSS